jgi:hypothetical protein
MENKFILMQDPVKWSKDGKGRIGYFSIGLKTLYPDKGFSSCDQFGNTDYFGPSSKPSGQFAFLDEESKKQFKGKINYDKEKDIYFAVVNLVKEE